MGENKYEHKLQSGSTFVCAKGIRVENKTGQEIQIHIEILPKQKKWVFNGNRYLRYCFDRIGEGLEMERIEEELQHAKKEHGRIRRGIAIFPDYCDEVDA